MALDIQALPKTILTTKGNSKYSTSSSLTNQVRARFVKYYEQNQDEFDKEDIKKLFETNYYIDRCLSWQKNNVDSALKMVIECFKWRKSSKIIYRTDDYFPSEFFMASGVFRYQPDKDGNPTLYMRVKLIKKMPELDDALKEFVAYQIFKLDEECGKMRAIGLVFDCSDISFSNIRFDMLKYLITIMTNYFTWSIKYILVLELPWVLNAIQKMVFAMLPEEAKTLILFKNRKGLIKLIDSQNLPDYLGGTCSIPYNEVPDGCQSLAEIGYERYTLTQESLLKCKKMYDDIFAFEK